MGVVVIGGGPAGLRAAEVAAACGAKVTLFEAQRSVGRKFLLAGRGGLNLTHGEATENFPARYRAERERWRALLGEFGPDDLRAWAAKLQIETYVGTSGRVFPRGQKAAALLRAWVRRLREVGVTLNTGERWIGLTKSAGGWSLSFTSDHGSSAIDARAVVLALGGASWPETGSDGKWPPLLAEHGVTTEAFFAANCGWEIAWPAEVLAQAEGLPLKNLTASAGDETVSGELLITVYGLEGGAIYRLGPVLRAMDAPGLRIDFKPQVSAASLRERAQQFRQPNEWYRAWKLSPGAIALLSNMGTPERVNLSAAIDRVKAFSIPLQRPRPIAEAISTAGGVAWSELDENLMLRKLPGVFLAGEMIDWEAPTGGYLLQGCFTTGTVAGRNSAAFRLS
jgi:uncharacterized flavoprotein (TIGR03862 family)